MPVERPDTLVPAHGLAIAREQDERVAREALFAKCRGQPPQLIRALEMPSRLQVAEAPARRHRRAAKKLGGRIERAAHAVAREKVDVERSFLACVVEPGGAVGIAGLEAREAAVVEERVRSPRSTAAAESQCRTRSRG